MLNNEFVDYGGSMLKIDNSGFSAIKILQHVNKTRK